MGANNKRLILDSEDLIVNIPMAEFESPGEADRASRISRWEMADRGRKTAREAAKDADALSIKYFGESHPNNMSLGLLN